MKRSSAYFFLGPNIYHLFLHGLNPDYPDNIYHSWFHLAVSMKKLYKVLIFLGIIALSVMPVQAFTAKSLTITLAPNGDAELNMQYELSFFEQSAVFFQIADPAEELKKAFDTHSEEPVTVLETTSTSAIIDVPGFATVRNGGATSTIITPQVSFEKAQQVMDGYWFAPLVSPDFSPGVTMVRFPDGHRDVYYDALTLPSVSHALEQ